MAMRERRRDTKKETHEQRDMFTLGPGAPKAFAEAQFLASDCSLRLQAAHQVKLRVSPAERAKRSSASTGEWTGVLRLKRKIEVECSLD